MEWEVDEPQKRTPDGSPRQYRRDHINKSSQSGWSVEKLDRSMSMERLYGLRENNMSVMVRLDGSQGSMDNSEHQVLDRSQRTPRKNNFKPSTCSPMKGSLSTKQCKSKEGYLGTSVDHSLDRSHSRSSVEIKWSADVNKSGDVYDSSSNGSPYTSPRQYRRAELNRSLDVLLENAQSKPPPRVTRNQSLDMLLDTRVEIGGSPTKSHETLNRSRNNVSDRFKEEGSKKRDEKKNSSNTWSQETFPSKVHRRQKQQTRVVRGDNGMCLEMTMLCIHGCTAALALGTVVVLGIMSTRWHHQRQVCPLFVRVPPGFHIHWGNEDMTGCYTAAFLPLIIVVLSLIFTALHYSVVRIWNENYMPTLAASRTLSLVTLAVTTLEAAVALTSTIILTEGFRQTCISFDLSLSWGEAPYTCRSNYNDRDFAYRLGYLHTFDLILGGLVCGWILVVLTIILVFLSVTRARLCACHCL
ncbi:hypothetical protein Pmani_015299 [Petrolisthes manimaculis]|uniref:Uncharacterized protein n=1 Tax=Petrolisthes manimaculis TaxID=1843537 RepID=A0AAE1PTT2_9EUCA|nr:hypothetical protein Pmani_015299 [Petrolisthes manimaculis]